MSDTIRILVADDHPVVREGLVTVLSTQADFEVVGEAGHGREVVDRAPALAPHVVLLDLEMPVLDGIGAIEGLKTTCPDAAVIVFTAYDTDDRIVAAIRAGARGYLLKGAPRQRIFDAVRVVHNGGSLLQPAVVSRLVARSEKPANPEPVVELTPRQQAVLELMAQGLTNREIADELAISERTVKFHVSAILERLDATNRTEAVSVAAQIGLVEMG